MKLSATKRENQSLAEVRNAGNIPGVLYKKGMETISVSVPDNVVRSAWKEIKDKQSFTLDLEGTEYTVVLQDMQTHAVSGKVLHMDFLAE